MRDIVEKYHRDGYAIVDGLFTEAEVDEMKQAGLAFTENLPDESERKIFSTTNKNHSKESYFMESADKIRPFFEARALDENGKLLVDPKVALNKVGHALHALHPVFRKYSFDERVKEICFQLGFEEPVVPQSMYIYKNPGLGTEVVSHQDASYLYNEPLKVVGLWIALDDATIENACLWIIPGSHKGGVHTRFIRNPDKTSSELCIYNSSSPQYQLSSFTPVPVKKGSCILLHGLVVHRSENNKSNQSRHAYTVHVMEQKDSTYSEDNWLQPNENYSFLNLYKNN